MIASDREADAAFALRFAVELNAEHNVQTPTESKTESKAEQKQTRSQTIETKQTALPLDFDDTPQQHSLHSMLSLSVSASQTPLQTQTQTQAHGCVPSLKSLCEEMLCAQVDHTVSLVSCFTFFVFFWLCVLNC